MFPSKQEALYRTMHNACPAYRNYNQGIGRLRHWITLLRKGPASILEVGCGNGLLCKILVTMGYDVTGLDIVPGPYERPYNFVKHDIGLGRLPFEDKTFDYCLSFDVLEHLETKWVEEHIWDMLRIAGDIIGTVACFERPLLHLTVREPEWWMEIISRHGGEIKYKVFDEPKGKTLLFYTKKESRNDNVPQKSVKSPQHFRL